MGVSSNAETETAVRVTRTRWRPDCGQERPFIWRVTLSERFSIQTAFKWYKYLFVQIEEEANSCRIYPVGGPFIKQTKKVCSSYTF